MTTPGKRRVLITGAAGQIGAVLAKAWQELFDLTLVDRRILPYSSTVRFIRADITDLQLMKKLTQGVDTIVHLAISGNYPHDWDRVAPANLTGTWAVYEAARQNRCGRVIFASTVEVDLNPATPYAGSKRWAEIMAQVYTERNDLSIICLRLGSFSHPKSAHIWPKAAHLGYLLTHRDACQLFTCCIEAPDSVKFGIFYGISDNHPPYFDTQPARQILGYAPLDDGYRIAQAMADNPLNLHRKVRIWLKYNLPRKINRIWWKMTARL